MSEEILQRYSKHWFEREYLPSYGIDPEHPVLDSLANRYGSELAALVPFYKDGAVLDVGAGAGLFLSQAKKQNWNVRGVEISSYGPIYAKEHFDIDIFQGSLFEAKFPDDYFDVVVLQDTIELFQIHDILCRKSIASCESAAQSLSQLLILAVYRYSFLDVIGH